MSKNSNKFSLKNSNKVRRSITIKNQKKIKSFYEELSNKVRMQIKQNNNLSGIRKKEQLMRIQMSLKSEIEKLNKSIEDNIKSGMEETSSAVVKDARNFLGQIGYNEFDSNNAFRKVPTEVVRNVLNGNVYQTGWTLSKAIWGDSKKTIKDINKIVAEGIALNRDIYDIAKDLEKYVNPSKRKDFKWSKMYPGTKRVVDYNAQRLARTMVSHAYQQSFKNVCENNPFVVAYKWVTADIHGRTCELCKHRAYDDHHGLGPGIFPKDDLPIDHPNGFCDFEAVVPDSISSMSDKIFEWYNSPEGTFPELDEYAKQFRR